MENIKRKESLDLNLDSKFAVLSDQNNAQYDQGKPLSDKSIEKIAKTFGKGISHIEADFDVSEAKSAISSITIRYRDGKKEKRTPSMEEIQKLTDLRNEIFKEKKKLLQVNKKGVQQGQLPYENWTGESINLVTGERRKLTPEEINMLKNLERWLNEEWTDDPWIINDEIEEIFKNLRRKLFGDE
ncbi:MAG: hypothetical protein ACP5K9_02090 [Candidatus Micrarchaeia archaeon]